MVLVFGVGCIYINTYILCTYICIYTNICILIKNLSVYIKVYYFYFFFLPPILFYSVMLAPNEILKILFVCILITKIKKKPYTTPNMHEFTYCVYINIKILNYPYFIISHLLSSGLWLRTLKKNIFKFLHKHTVSP